MSNLCFGCMKQLDDDHYGPCPYCGFDNNSEQQLPFLPLGTVLEDRYVVGKVISSDVQGAEYIGYDSTLQSAVIIREFLPEGICGRSRGSGANIAVKEDKIQLYCDMLKSFLKYFRTVAMLRDIPTLPSIYDIFNENNTAYTVEDYINVIPFKEYMERKGGALEWNDARPLFMPLISALNAMNKNGIRHLGVCPDNLFVTDKGKLVLRGFMFPETRQVGNGIRAKLIPGCAAPEQYTENAKLTEMTDVFGFTATLFYVLTGKLPESYEKRKQDSKLLISTNVVKRLPPHVVSTLANGLQLSQTKRIATFDELRAQLSSAPTVKAIREEIRTETSESAAKRENARMSKPKKSGIPNFAWGVISCICSLLIFSLIGYTWFRNNPFENIFTPAVNSSTESSDNEASNLNNGEYIPTPDLSNLKYDDLIEKDKADASYNVVFNTEFEYSDSVPQDYVLEQYPESGTQMLSGTTIYVTVSKGAKMRELPDIKNKTIDDIARLMAEQRLLTRQIYEYNDEIPKDCGIGYEPYQPGDKLEYGSTVTIIISKGQRSTDTDTDE